MGHRPTAIAFYGVQFEEGYEMPWDAEPFAGDIDEWWAFTQGGIENPGDDSGEGDWGACFERRRTYLAAHPCPALLAYQGSGECPSPIIACAIVQTDWDDTIRLALPEVADEQKNALIEFLKTYCQPPDEFFSPPDFDDVGWRLAAYWG